MAGLLGLAPLALFAPPGVSQQVAEVQVAPGTVQVAVNGRQGIFATVYDASGNVLPNVRITWYSSDLKVVRVEPDPSAPGVGTLIGVAAGIAAVEARAGGRSGTAVVQVLAAGAPARVTPGSNLPPATVLRIDPPSVLIMPSEAVQLSARFIRDDGSAGAPMKLTWRSHAPHVAAVGEAGSVVGVSPGQGVVEASSESGLVANVPVQVRDSKIALSRAAVSMSPGGVDTARVVVPEQSNRPIASQLLQWQSSNEGVARVSPLGIVSAVGPGRTEVVVTGFLQQLTLPVTVHRPVEYLELSPRVADSVLVPVGGAVRFAARALAADNSDVPEAVIRWLVVDTTKASFDPGTGNVTGKAFGVTKLRVFGPGTGLDTAWTLNVIAGGLKLATDRLGLAVGERATLSAAFTDDRGTAISPATGVRWTTTNGDVARVDGGGGVTGIGFGHAMVVGATSWGKADTTDVYVQGEMLVSSSRGGTPDIYAFDRGSPPRLMQVTRDSAAEVYPSYSQDGTRIAYISTRDGNTEVYVMNADGSAPRRLTNTPAAEETPRWLADGRQIIFASNRSGKNQVWVMNADGGEPRQLTQEPATNYQPSVSPDGKTIAFTSNRDGNYDIYLMSPDGSNQRNLTKSPGTEKIPHWIDAGRIAFIREQRAGSTIESTIRRMALESGDTATVSPANLQVTDFAVSKAGDLIAMLCYGTEGTQQISRLYLLPMSAAGPGTPVEIPRQSPGEQLSGPAFRK